MRSIDLIQFQLNSSIMFKQKHSWLESISEFAVRLLFMEFYNRDARIFEAAMKRPLENKDLSAY